MRITPSGDYEFCRWAQPSAKHNIKNITPTEYFQQCMQPIRDKLASGEAPTECHPCLSMENQCKVSGRQKQLLKVGVRLDEFEKTLSSSPWTSVFSESKCHQLPQDWQIDLGNYCNGACIFCSPVYSSRLAAEWKKIGFIDQLPPSNWTDDLNLIQRFVDILKQSPHIQYLHFIGGETLITPAFEIILKALIETGLNKTVVIGFTTNLSVWDNNIVELLNQFQGVNLGMSIESFNAVNDYVRWPASLPTVLENLERWVEIGKKRSWLMQLRTTPTCLTVGELLPIYDYALENNIVVESCNFLYHPEVLKPSVLPLTYRNTIINKMQDWVDKYPIDSDDIIINIRNSNTVRAQLVQDLTSYINYLKNEPDESHKLPELMSWLKRIEANRKNSVLTYLPEYEELFKSSGY